MCYYIQIYSILIFKLLLRELFAMTNVSALYNMAATNHTWLLNIWNVASVSEEMNFHFI